MHSNMFNSQPLLTWPDFDFSSFENLVQDLLHQDVGVVYGELVEASVRNVAERISASF